MHIAGFILVQRQPWYSVEIHSACTVQNESISELTMSPTAPEKMESSSAFTSFENTTIWFLGTINCIIVAVVFSKGKPFRQPTYTNYIFVLVLITQLGVCLFILFADIPELYRRLDLLCTPILWRVSIVIMLSLNFIVSLVAEVQRSPDGSATRTHGPWMEELDSDAGPLSARSLLCHSPMLFFLNEKKKKKTVALKNKTTARQMSSVIAIMSTISSRKRFWCLVEVLLNLTINHRKGQLPQLREENHNTRAL
ncbi:probable cation-transporting ATPase 13A4 isoform X1 [Hylobates moloch]|uniref:probable cation-transporting ATPase 13A4 isoform X1 n=1 Tax=Hylobates moloch TaxID=81572 RepID=UPI002675ECE2|nr:probable cation-transporting ATPase 13A4 isoform X1 [Hylobates moloch]